jgi:hypothetical protein
MKGISLEKFVKFAPCNRFVYATTESCITQRPVAAYRVLCRAAEGKEPLAVADTVNPRQRQTWRRERSVEGVLSIHLLIADIPEKRREQLIEKQRNK